VNENEVAGATEALLLTCMDYRFVVHTAHFMATRGLADKYDHIVLAGASLGAITSSFHQWNATFWDHLGLSIRLHHIKRLIVLDHRECGAYREIYGPNCCDTREKETAVHKTQLEELRRRINYSPHAGLKVELCLMDLDGTVEEFF
jgi:hypothetical protein